MHPRLYERLLPVTYFVYLSILKHSYLYLIYFCDYIWIPNSLLTYKMDTTILQWNLDSYFQKHLELKLLVRNYNPEVICLQETQLSPTNLVKFKHFEILRKDYCEGNRACGGVAIFIKDCIYFEPLNIISPLQVIAARIYQPIPYTICNIYLPPLRLITKQELLDIVSQLEPPYVIVGDFNAHNTLWGSNHTNPKGKIIEEILTQNSNIILLNQYGEPTHFNISTRTESTIDLALSSSSISKY